MTGDGCTDAPGVLAELVSRAAAARPEAVALIGFDTERTWAAVEARTASLAASLLAAGVVPGDRVAVARRKGPESFEAVHGILRAGAVVVPIDPLAPPAAARLVLRDAAVRAVVGDARTVTALDPWTAVDDLAVVIVEGGDVGGRAVPWTDAVGRPADAALPTVAGDDVAYIIYTSGSTGRPKGIVHTHRSAMAYAERAVTEYALTCADRLAGMNPLHFDMSTLELYAAPLAGATVVVMAEAHLQFPASFTARSADQAVTIWYTVPFLLRSVVERGGLDRRPLPTLRSVLYGGEPYPGASLRRLMEALPGVRVVNVYGPAEVNACTHHHVDRPADVGDDVPIGRPWAGADVRVVDDHGHDVGPGEPGELWVSTPTVMRGYWRLDDLSRARLHRRAAAPDWYATGDVVVLDDDGVLWFRGRRDHQVKVRGVRLELEAIEGVLTDAPDVVHAVAAASGPPGDASHIVAAVVLRAGARPDPASLRRWCGERLPSIAVPRSFTYRPDMPSTASGKIDRAAVRAALRDTDPSDIEQETSP
jgi:amino acid adenylation domain-containing protein